MLFVVHWTRVLVNLLSSIKWDSFHAKINLHSVVISGKLKDKHRSKHSKVEGHMVSYIYNIIYYATCKIILYYCHAVSGSDLFPFFFLSFLHSCFSLQQLHLLIFFIFFFTPTFNSIVFSTKFIDMGEECFYFTRQKNTVEKIKRIVYAAMFNSPIMFVSHILKT